MLPQTDRYASDASPGHVFSSPVPGTRQGVLDFLSEFKPDGRNKSGMHRIFQQSWYLFLIYSLSAAYAAHHLVAQPVGRTRFL